MANSWASEATQSSNSIKRFSDFLGLPEGTTVPFKNGRPDFSNFSYGDFAVKGLNGNHKVNMPLIRQQIADEFGFSKADGLPNENAARRWLRANNLTPDHGGGTLVQLIDGNLHKLIRHTGGAFDLRMLFGGE